MTKKLIGITKDEFDSFVESSNEKGIELQLTDLNFIDLLKEKGLPQIFINFKEEILESINKNIEKDYNLFVYTEIRLPNLSDGCLLDGLILVLKEGKIKDAILLELEKERKEQCEKYLNVAQKYGIPKFLTTSNLDSFIFQHTIISKYLKLFQLTKIAD